jgi:ArsR family transcriptional regulator
MENEMAAKRLAELGHNTRLSIFRYLVKLGSEGAPVGGFFLALYFEISGNIEHISFRL